jgi:hypothetical protein
MAVYSLPTAFSTRRSYGAPDRLECRRTRTKSRMRLPKRSVWIRRPLGAVVALLAATLFAPGVVRASCGDYLTTGAHPVMPTATGAASDSMPVLPAPAAPCSGPNCSGRSPILPNIPPAPAPVSGEQWGCAVVLPAYQGPGFASWLLQTTPDLPIRCGNSIYHPPRLHTFLAV